MRTTLDIDDDVLRAAKAIAAAKRTTAGRVLSDLARELTNVVESTRTASGLVIDLTELSGLPAHSVS